MFVWLNGSRSRLQKKLEGTFYEPDVYNLEYWDIFIFRNSYQTQGDAFVCDQSTIYFTTLVTLYIDAMLVYYSNTEEYSE